MLRRVLVGAALLASIAGLEPSHWYAYAQDGGTGTE